MQQQQYWYSEKKCFEGEGEGEGEGFVSKLYFYELLDEHYEGKRILYAENTFDEPRAMAILGSWLLDAYAGDAFYDDSSRLHRDLMENAATVYLKQLFKPMNN